MSESAEVGDTTGFAGKHVIVTGAASGIGRACAVAFAKAGATVAALDMDEAGLGRLSTEVPGCVAYRADVTKRASVRDAISAAVDTNGPPTVCANVAGVYPLTTLATVTEERYRTIIDVNLLGTVLTTQAAVEAMPQSGGAIVNFASVDAFTAKPDQLIYSAAKAAIVSVTRSLAIDLADKCIRVNAVAPGPVRTEPMITSGRLEKAIKRVPLGRVAEPSEIAGVVMWLCGPESSFITGETIVASGGLLIR
ncbi:MAG: SDR family oxidoreductase [Streptosporangiales bacterium]|nr:SDR family oxidoreductase [Streptosporangiales bacterium]